MNDGSAGGVRISTWEGTAPSIGNTRGHPQTICAPEQVGGLRWVSLIPKQLGIDQTEHVVKSKMKENLRRGREDHIDKGGRGGGGGGGGRHRGVCVGGVHVPELPLDLAAHRLRHRRVLSELIRILTGWNGESLKLCGKKKTEKRCWLGLSLPMTPAEGRWWNPRTARYVHQCSRRGCLKPSMAFEPRPSTCSYLFSRVAVPGIPAPPPALSPSPSAPLFIFISGNLFKGDPVHTRAGWHSSFASAGIS